MQHIINLAFNEIIERAVKLVAEKIMRKKSVKEKIAELEE